MSGNKMNPSTDSTSPVEEIFEPNVFDILKSVYVIELLSEVLSHHVSEGLFRSARVYSVLQVYHLIQRCATLFEKFLQILESDRGLIKCAHHASDLRNRVCELPCKVLCYDVN
uniref:Uncharacterized protein n=1 Tax=Physcomitrium patens TaxID=3218 RepID=A0A2K1IIT1_PHYPA|nr:hypothetical protein PHYPA_027883 [Physcomitrium patens]